MATYNITVNKNSPEYIDVNNLVNNGSDGYWQLGSSITHNNSIGSYAEKIIPSLIVGNEYKITYTISSYTSCNVRVFLGNTSGISRNTTGTYTEVLSLTGEPKIRFYSNGEVTISYYKIEELVNIVNDSLLDISTMENKSWTLSYNPILQQWISFHSYLPNNYVLHPNKLLAKTNESQLKLINSGEYGKYFDEDIKPFIIETVFNDNPLDTKVFDNITVNLDSTDGNITTNKFFDNMYLYTEEQCSGYITLDTSNLTKKEKNWNINKFNDITSNQNASIFVKDWDNIKNVYPIDKVININKIDVNKPWYQRGRFRDKYLSVRFIESNIDNEKLVCKFIYCIYRRSQR